MHFAGNPADMDAINKLSKGHGAYVVEDAAQAHGSIYRNVRVGALGDIGGFQLQKQQAHDSW